MNANQRALTKGWQYGNSLGQQSQDSRRGSRAFRAYRAGGKTDARTTFTRVAGEMMLLAEGLGQEQGAPMGWASISSRPRRQAG